MTGKNWVGHSESDCCSDYSAHQRDEAAYRDFHGSDYRSLLRREWYNVARTTESLPKACEHGQIGVKPDALNAAHAERREAVVVLQAPKLSFHGGADGTVVFPLPEAYIRDEQYRIPAVMDDTITAILRVETDGDVVYIGAAAGLGSAGPAGATGVGATGATGAAGPTGPSSDPALSLMYGCP